MADDLVEVARFFDLQEAEVVKTLLIGCGVRAEVFGDNQGNMVPYMSTISPTRVMVLASAKAEALAILAAEGADEPASDTPAESAAERHETAQASEAKAAVRRVFVSAIFGLFIAPVLAQFYSLWLARDVFGQWQNLTGADKTKFTIAVLFDLTVLALVAMMYNQLRS